MLCGRSRSVGPQGASGAATRGAGVSGSGDNTLKVWDISSLDTSK